MDAEGDNQNEVIEPFEKEERYSQKKVSNTFLCDKTKNIKILKQQESVDSFVSQNSTGLPDLESICEDSSSREDKAKRKKLFVVEVDGRVLAESSKECYDDKDSSVTKVVSVDVDEYWTNDKTQAPTDSYEMENKEEHTSKSQGKSRRSNEP